MNSNDFVRKALKVISPAMVFLSGFGVLAQAAKPANAAQKMPAGSYLGNHVHGLTGFKKAVETTPRLQRLYGSDLQMSTKTLLAFIENDLKEVVLKKPVRANVHYLNKSGFQKAKYETLHAGTIVFAQGSLPLFKEDCGNFIGNVTPRKVRKAGKKPVSAVKIPQPKTPVAVETFKPQAPLPLQATPLAPFAFTAPTPAQAPSPFQQLPSEQPKSGNNDLFPVLAGVGVAILTFSKGSGHSGTMPTPVGAPVPEASTGVDAVFGGLMLAGLALRRRMASHKPS